MTKKKTTTATTTAKTATATPLFIPSLTKEDFNDILKDICENQKRENIALCGGDEENVFTNLCESQKRNIDNGKFLKVLDFLGVTFSGNFVDLSKVYTAVQALRLMKHVYDISEHGIEFKRGSDIEINFNSLDRFAFAFESVAKNHSKFFKM